MQRSSQLVACFNRIVRPHINKPGDSEVDQTKTIEHRVSSVATPCDFGGIGMPFSIAYSCNGWRWRRVVNLPVPTLSIIHVRTPSSVLRTVILKPRCRAACVISLVICAAVRPQKGPGNYPLMHFCERVTFNHWAHLRISRAIKMTVAMVVVIGVNDALLFLSTQSGPLFMSIT